MYYVCHRCLDEIAVNIYTLSNFVLQIKRNVGSTHSCCAPENFRARLGLYGVSTYLQYLKLRETRSKII